MKTQRDPRRVGPINPRVAGRARMERPVHNAFAAMRLTDALTLGFVRDNEIAKMREHLDDIVSIIDETITDDDRAGHLMRTIGYAIDGVFGLGRIDGGNEPGRRLRERDEGVRKGGENGWGDKKRKDADSRWRNDGWKIYWEKRGQFAEGDPRREENKSALARVIYDEAGDTPGHKRIVIEIGKWDKKRPLSGHRSPQLSGT
jgi:hypothetical protein